jgi:hypothetical protein
MPPDNAAGSPTPIVIDALDPETMALWRTVAKIAQALDDQDVRWCLVGGLMVALFAIEAGQISRPTADIDILGDARQRPSATESITGQLTQLGATRHEIGGFESEKGFRFAIDGQIVDVLAPDGLGRPAMTEAQFQTIQIPGGSQALNRTETVIVVIDDQPISLHRPTLTGAASSPSRACRSRRELSTGSK